MLGVEVSAEDARILDWEASATRTDDELEQRGEIIDEWTNALDSAGYYAHWDAGDVVVFDLRPLSDEDREAFFDSIE